jgi:hypothetical protein
MMDGELTPLDIGANPINECDITATAFSLVDSSGCIQSRWATDFAFLAK